MYSMRIQNVSVSSLVSSICLVRVATSCSESKRKIVPEFFPEDTKRLPVRTQLPELYCLESHAVSTGTHDVSGNVRMYWCVSTCMHVYGWTKSGFLDQTWTKDTSEEAKPPLYRGYLHVGPARCSTRTAVVFSVWY